MSATTLDSLRRSGVLGDLDIELALRLSRRAQAHQPEVALAIALCSRAVLRGHVCLDLAALCRDPSALLGGSSANDAPLVLPEPNAWQRTLQGSAIIGAPDAAAPLVLHAGRVYLRRIWDAERSLGMDILRRARLFAPGLDGGLLRDGLARLFPECPASAPSGQALAALIALLRPFAVVTGGPGTGKTSTVVKLLVLLGEQALAAGRPPPRTLLLAPTGKAAGRLGQAISVAKTKALDGNARVIAAIPDKAATLHRALGLGRPNATPALAGSPEIIVLDEASMVDIELMATLFAAAPHDARIILLGDENQLASIEAGAVLGDLVGDSDGAALSATFCDHAAALGISVPRTPGARVQTGIWDSVLRLRESHRYAADSGIRLLADAIVSGRADDALEILADEAFPDVSLAPTLSPNKPGLGLLGARLVAAVADSQHATSDDARLAVLGRVRLLCAHRRGPASVEDTNQRARRDLERAGLAPAGRGHFVGEQLLVTQNDPELSLYNGDTGVVVAGEHGELVAAFPGTPHPRRLGLAWLPNHEPVFAMSIHKSQGSEFDHVAIVLPRLPSAVLSRELLFTAVTRARQSVVIAGSAAIVKRAITRRVLRSSGLGQLLWGEQVSLLPP